MTENALTRTDIDAFPQQAAEIGGLFAEAQQVIAGALDALHQESDPDQRGQIAAVTREWCDYVVALAGEQRALTGAAAEMANAAMQQRDEAIRALDELVSAIDDMDYDNAHVRGLAEAVEQEVVEWAYDDAYEGVSEGFYDDIISNFRLHLGLDWVQAEELLDALREGTSAAITPARLDALIRYLTALRDERI